VDARELDPEPGKLHEPQLGVGHVRPGAQRHLEQVRGLQSGNSGHTREKAPDQLYVESPARMERLLEGCREQWRGVEGLGPTLGIVDAQVEDQRSRGGKDAAQIVARRVALDGRAEKRDARRECRLRARAPERRDEAEHLLCRRREVRVEKADQPRAHLQRLQ